MPATDGGLGTSLVGEKIVINSKSVAVMRLLGEGKRKVGRGFESGSSSCCTAHTPFNAHAMCRGCSSYSRLFLGYFLIFVNCCLLRYLQRWVFLCIFSQGVIRHKFGSVTAQLGARRKQRRSGADESPTASRWISFRRNTTRQTTLGTQSYLNPLSITAGHCREGSQTIVSSEPSFHH